MIFGLPRSLSRAVTSLTVGASSARRHIALSVLGAALLSACGGGGGNSEPTAPSQTSAQQSQPQTLDIANGVRVHPTRVLVKLREGADTAMYEKNKAELGLSQKSSPDTEDTEDAKIQVLEASAKSGISEAEQRKQLSERIAAMRQSGLYEYVEPDLIMKAPQSPKLNRTINLGGTGAMASSSSSSSSSSSGNISTSTSSATGCVATSSSSSVAIGGPNAPASSSNSSSSTCISGPSVDLSGETTDAAYVDGRLYGFKNTGQNGGVAGVDANIPKAWAMLGKAAPVTVAVIDSGVRHTHQELRKQMWRNPKETEGNATDNDGNGYKNDIFGANVSDPVDANGNINPSSGTGDVTPNANVGGSADAYHGTFVAGIIASGRNDGFLMVGVAPNARIMAVKIADQKGDFSLSSVIRGVQYAVKNKAKIANLSLRSSQQSQILYDVMRRATGTLFVVASGNMPRGLDDLDLYPSAIANNLPNVLTVSAHDRRGGVALIGTANGVSPDTVSAIGARTVHVAAPGADILSLSNSADDGYDTFNGTSFAAPYVAGIAALMIGSRPRWSAAQVADRITNSAVALPSFKNKTISEGRVDAFRALTEQPSGQINATVYAELKDGLTAGKPSRVVVRLHDLLRITDATASIKIGDLPPVPMTQDVVPRPGTNPLAGALATLGLYAATITPPKGATEQSIELSISAPGKQTLRKTLILPVVTRPDNDDFANSIALQGDKVSVDGTLVAATRESGDIKIENIHLYGYTKSVWYSWVAPTSGKYIATLDDGNSTDISVDIFTGKQLSDLQRITPQSPTLLAPGEAYEGCTEGDCIAYSAMVIFDAVAGTSYPIAVANVFLKLGDNAKPFQLKIAPFVMPK